MAATQTAVTVASNPPWSARAIPAYSAISLCKTRMRDLHRSFAGQAQARAASRSGEPTSGFFSANVSRETFGKRAQGNGGGAERGKRRRATNADPRKLAAARFPGQTAHASAKETAMASNDCRQRGGRECPANRWARTNRKQGRHHDPLKSAVASFPGIVSRETMPQGRHRIAPRRKPQRDRRPREGPDASGHGRPHRRFGCTNTKIDRQSAVSGTHEER